MKGKEIEQYFIDYFKRQDHKHLPSGPVVVRDNPTLMFNSAGMVQFQNWFRDLSLAKYPRVVTSQKCLRAGGKHNDLENVGYTNRHHTFFKMLGNFSFGDYFKERAIELAWNFLTKELGIKKDRLSVTIHHSDQESRKIWRKILGGESKITEEGDADNFWTVGNRGPCGPCTEIFHQTKEGQEPVEIWNLVFTEYNQTDKAREKLPKPCVDTGMGLERITAVIEGKEDNYETSLIYPLVEAVVKRVDDFDEWRGRLSSGIDDEPPVEKMNKPAIRDKKGHLRPFLKVIADHIVSACFLIHEDVIPSNKNEGYVLRKILRRMFMHGLEVMKDGGSIFSIDPRHIGFPYEDGKLVEKVVDLHPELKESLPLIKDTLLEEVNLFAGVMRVAPNFHTDLFNLLEHGGREAGLVKLTYDGRKLSGECIFKLEDTHGLPLDLIRKICELQKVEMDMEGYELCVKRRQALAEKGLLKKEPINADAYSETQTLDNGGLTSFAGNLHHDDKKYIVLSATPFHPQGGGQMGDKGTITVTKSNGLEDRINVINAIAVKNPSGERVIFHEVEDLAVDLSKGVKVTVKIDQAHRKKLAQGHTATHILNEIISNPNIVHPGLDESGEFVFSAQRGSNITAEKFTFDFTCRYQMTQDILNLIEKMVNQVIQEDVKLETKTLEDLQKAKKEGYKPLPGHDYGAGKLQGLEIAATLPGGGKFSSKELCGGSHLDRTGEIGYFKIIKESSISRGVRRIEAVTGQNAVDHIQNLEKILTEKITNLEKENSTLKKEVEEMQMRMRRDKILRGDARREKTRYGVDFLIHTSPNLLPSDIRPLLAELSRRRKAIHLVHCKSGGKISLGISVPESISEVLSAVAVLKEPVAVLKGANKPSGNELIAQGGGRSPESLSKALDSIKKQLL